MVPVKTNKQKQSVQGSKVASMTTWWTRGGGNQAQGRKKKEEEHIGRLKLFLQRGINNVHVQCCLCAHYVHSHNHACNLWRPAGRNQLISSNFYMEIIIKRRYHLILLLSFGWVGQLSISTNQIAGFFDDHFPWKESSDILVFLHGVRHQKKVAPETTTVTCI